jgi:RNA polymerase-associated protein CTR9
VSCRLFASLASDPSPVVPYNRELADERRKYGDTRLRKADEHLAAQRQFESETQAKLDAARQKRQEERDRQEAREVSRLFLLHHTTESKLYLQRERMEELRKQAEMLAEERRQARMQALEWSREVKMESDEERERKAKKSRKTKAENGSGDEAGEPKKKKRGKIKKSTGNGDAEDQALFSNDEDEKPARKVNLILVTLVSLLDVALLAHRQKASHQGR